MDTGNFFDFDSSTLQNEDQYEQYAEEDGDEYNALNDETFGSAAAVDLDWEESHERFANLSQAQKDMMENSHFQQKHKIKQLEPNEIKNLERDLSSLYTKNVKEDSVDILGNLLSDCIHPSIPGKSIWSYDLPPMTERTLPTPTGIDIFSSSLNKKQDTCSSLPLPSAVFPQKVKTVAELESEMRANQLLRQFGSNYNNMQPRNNDVNFTNRLPYGQYLPTTNARNGIMGNYVNVPDQFKSRPPPMNHFMMTQRSGLPNNFANGRQWGPAFVSGNVLKQRCPHYSSADVHNFPQNISHFPRSHFNNVKNDRRYFDNSQYIPQQIFRDKAKDDLDAEWEEWHRIKQRDPYAGLLNPKEKAWLRTIEAKQHAIENPYEDDYYFVMLNLKKQKRKDQEIVRINGMQLLADKGRDLKEYVPPTMANSLGKLQAVSVNAPRKIIDLPNIHTESSASTPVQKELKKKRHVLMYIEKLCNIQIELDDLERKVRGLADCPTRDSYKSKFGQQLKKLWIALTVSENTLNQIFNISKGRYLMSHLLDWLDESKMSLFFGIVFQNLTLIMNEDQNYLINIWIMLDRFIANASQKHLLQLVENLDSQLCCESTNGDILSCKQFGLSLVLAIMIRGEVLWSVMEENEEWPNFLKKANYTLANFYSMNAISVLPSLVIASSLGHIRVQINRCKLSDEQVKKNALNATILIESVLR